MSDRKLIPGKFVWFELISKNARKAQAFYRDVLGWKVAPFSMGDETYEMVLAGETPDTMIGGYAAPKNGRQPAHWISYVSVEDVDAAANAAAANGGKVVDAPFDAPGVGRLARIADPQGAQLSVFKNESGDPPDDPTLHGSRFCWNELHTTEPAKALSFYEQVLGFSHRSMDMGPGGGVYHILSKGGVDRAGVTSHLPAGVPPHWLPYVAVDDPDATIERARRLGATIPVSPMDIPGVGRFGVMVDSTGARLAIIKPLPNAEMGGADMNKQVRRGPNRPDKILVENVNHPGHVTPVDAAMYRAMRQAFLTVLPKRSPGLTLAEIRERLLSRVPKQRFPGGEKVGWWAKTVQLDLEAKGLVVRDRSRPLRLHRV